MLGLKFLDVLVPKRVKQLIQAKTAQERLTKTRFGNKSEVKLRGKVASKALVVGATKDVKRNEYLIGGIEVGFD